MAVDGGQDRARDDAGSERADRDVAEHGGGVRIQLERAGHVRVHARQRRPACGSPKTTPDSAQGSHTFAVQARDAAGNQDATPATRTWTVDTVAPETVLDPADRRGTRQTRRPPLRSPPSRAPCSTAGSTTRPSHLVHVTEDLQRPLGGTAHVAGVGARRGRQHGSRVRSCARGRSWPRRRRRRRASCHRRRAWASAARRPARSARRGRSRSRAPVTRPGRRSREDRGEPCRGLPQRRRPCAGETIAPTPRVRSSCARAGCQGLRSAVLKVFSNAPGGELDVDLSGTGTAPRRPARSRRSHRARRSRRPGRVRRKRGSDGPARRRRRARYGGRDRCDRCNGCDRCHRPAALPAPPALLAPPARRVRSARRVLPAGTRG